MNLGKLVLLGVHGRLRNAKIAKKYFPMSEWGVSYADEKLKKRAFQKAKDTPIGYMVSEIQPRKSRD